MTTTTEPGAQPPEPLATAAATASVPMGPCASCEAAILRAQRYAVLPSGRLAHVLCIAEQATGRQPAA